MTELDTQIKRIETALVDIAEAVDKATGARGLSGIHAAIADAVEAIQAMKAQDLSELVKAVREIQPAVQVSVPPAAPPVVHVVQAAKFTVTIADRYGAPERTLTIVREPV